MLIVHWTTLRNLVAILTDMELYEQTSFTTDFAYTIDQDHNAPYGMVFDTDTIAVQPLPPGTRGVTAYEMQVERRNREAVDLSKTPWEYFIVRDRAHKRSLERVLRGLELTERVEIVT